mmetsp:Transcript_20442/g.28320  ORF Transcript_20442/g.28320 Transcript_20442/m.28320 type:complete len:110 (+) Transcript_20442:120-449(+)
MASRKAASSLFPRLHRLDVSLTNRFCKARIVRIDSEEVVVQASSYEPQFTSLNSKSDIAAAAAVGELLVQRAKDASIPAVHWQKPLGKPFHGKMATIVNTVRDEGLVLN